jgi:hypothetical protein
VFAKCFPFVHPFFFSGFHRLSQSTAADGIILLNYVQGNAILWRGSTPLLLWLALFQFRPESATSSQCIAPLSGMQRLLSGVVVPLLCMALLFITALIDWLLCLCTRQFDDTNSKLNAQFQNSNPNAVRLSDVVGGPSSAPRKRHALIPEYFCCGDLCLYRAEDKCQGCGACDRSACAPHGACACCTHRVHVNKVGLSYKIGRKIIVCDFHTFDTRPYMRTTVAFVLFSCT